MTDPLNRNIYIVENNDGNVSDLDRSRLRRRKRRVDSCGHVSDDKKYDCFAMQYFSTSELEWI